MRLYLNKMFKLFEVKEGKFTVLPTLNPNFVKSALSKYKPKDFIELVKSYNIPFHEKHKGQLFCDRSAEDIIAMLKAECDAGKVQWRMPESVKSVTREGAHFRIGAAHGEIQAKRLVIATGGLSIPKIGATDFAFRIARQFDVPLIAPSPALVPLTFGEQAWTPFVPMAGISLEVDIATGGWSAS